MGGIERKRHAMSKAARAHLHRPTPAWEGCIHFAVERDTRGVPLTDDQRFNYFPASPLPLFAWILEGDLHGVGMVADPQKGQLSAPLPRMALIGPSRHPAASWSPGAIHALWVSFYPDALSRMWGIRAEDYVDAIVPLEGLLPCAASDALASIGAGGSSPFHRLESVLAMMGADRLTVSGGATDLRGWVASLRAPRLSTQPGPGLRQSQRRIRARAGQSQRGLGLFARVEEAFVRSMAGEGEGMTMAALAAEAGYSDQSHLGREIRRVTGWSPQRFGERMRADESFWIYRLLGDYLSDAPGNR